MGKRKSIVGCFVVVAGATLWGCSPAPNEAPKPPPAAAPAPVAAAPRNPKCPDFKVSFEIGKEGPNTVSLTLAPALPAGVNQVIWNTTAGHLSDNGTTAVVRDLPPGILFTVAIEIVGLDAACDRHDAFHSASVQMP